MSAGFASIDIQNDQILTIKGYEPIIHDYTCDEISAYAKELNLGCLKYLDGAANCIFNYDQCQDILNIEIPALRSKNLSKHAQEALDGLELAIKNTNDPWAFIYFEGD
jgi:hypothetical protein